MKEQIRIIEGKFKHLEEIKELWQKLNEHHMASTDYFKDKFKQFTFDSRMKSLMEKGSTGDIQVLLAEDTEKSKKIGYCVSTVTTEAVGEIDSLFVEKEYRKLGIGDMLMKAALQWLEAKQPKEIILTVAGGNERVLSFYRQYGFQTASVKMAKTEQLEKPLQQFKDVVISSDKGLLKLEDIVALLGKSYWASERSREKIIKSIENSLCFGVYLNEIQIGFARVITDYATFAYLCDVIIDEAYRGQGIGKALMTYIVEYPSLQDIKNFCLLTMDAHKLYQKYGFSNMQDPSRFMLKRKNDKG